MNVIFEYASMLLHRQIIADIILQETSNNIYQLPIDRPNQKKNIKGGLILVISKNSASKLANYTWQ